MSIWPHKQSIDMPHILTKTIIWPQTSWILTRAQWRMLVYYEFRSSIQVRFFFKNISKIYFSTNNKQLVMLRIFYIFKKVLTSIKMLNEILRHKRTHLNFQCCLLPVTYLLCASWHLRPPQSFFNFLCWLQQSLPHPVTAIPHRSSLFLLSFARSS